MLIFSALLAETLMMQTSAPLPCLCRAKHADPRFPVGKARLEAVGVILCACIMTLSSFEVIRSSGEDLWAGGFEGDFSLEGLQRVLLRVRHIASAVI